MLLEHRDVASGFNGGHWQAPRPKSVETKFPALGRGGRKVPGSRDLPALALGVSSSSDLGDALNRREPTPSVCEYPGPHGWWSPAPASAAGGDADTLRRSSPASPGRRKGCAWYRSNVARIGS